MCFMDKLMFSDLTLMLDKCISATNSTIREKYMKKYFERTLKLQEIYRKEYPGTNSCLFPLVRILLSSEEHERSYGIQDKTIRKILISSIKISGNEATRIEQCNEDELADTVFEAVSARSSRKSKMTIQDVDKMLNNLCENQKQQDQQKEFEYLFMNGSASDFKWIVKIVLKNMKLKITINKVLQSYHPLAPKLFTKFNHLSKVCEIIESGQAEEAVKDVVKPFYPIRPMLSQKFSNNMDDMLTREEFYQEIKLDGERFQMHMENGCFKYYSRNAHDFSENFNIVLSPLINFKTVIHSIILDGEMVVFNRQKNRFVTKGETNLDVKKMKDVNHNLRPCFCAFDVLYLNGVSYIGQPFSMRSEILHSLFDDQVGVLIKTNPIKIRDVEHLVTLFNDAMNNEEEGIILKKADSKYMPGERENGGWYKVKADYFDGEVVKDFDCVIIGGNFQNKHKRDYIQTYQVGAIEKLEDGTFNVFAIGEVVHGLTRVDRMKLHDKLRHFFINFPSNREFEFEKGHVFFGKNKPDVFIPPHKSVVLQIRVSELAPSSDYHTNYTFRFPRIYEIRYDKIWDESATLKEFQELYKGDNSNDRRVKKVNQRNVHKDDIISPTKKSRKFVSSRSNAIALFCHDSQEDVEPIDNVLEGKEFCVLTTSSTLPSVHDLKILLKIHGASMTEFPRRNKTFALIAGDIQQKIKIYINEKIYNIIKADWVVENFTIEKPLDDFPELKPSHFHFMNEEMKNHFASKFDRFGDSYTQLFKTPDELMEILNGMDTGNASLSKDQYEEFESELYNENFQNPNFFRGFYASFNYSDHPNYLMQTAKSIFKFRAGHITSDSNEYVFVDKCDLNIVNHHEFNDRKLIDFHYILNSNDAGKLLNIADYLIDA